MRHPARVTQMATKRSRSTAPLAGLNLATVTRTRPHPRWSKASHGQTCPSAQPRAETSWGVRGIPTFIAGRRASSADRAPRSTWDLSCTGGRSRRRAPVAGFSVIRFTADGSADSIQAAQISRADALTSLRVHGRAGLRGPGRARDRRQRRDRGRAVRSAGGGLSRDSGSLRRQQGRGRTGGCRNRHELRAGRGASGRPARSRGARAARGRGRAGARAGRRARGQRRPEPARVLRRGRRHRLRRDAGDQPARALPAGAPRAAGACASAGSGGSCSRRRSPR